MWTIPYFVHQGPRRVTVSPAIPMSLQSVQYAADCQLHRIGAVKDGDSNRHFVARPDWLAHAHRATTNNPEDHFSWGQRPADQARRFYKKCHADMMQFCDAIYQKGVGVSKDEVVWWWVQFCNQILDTLLNQQKPVDFLFFKFWPTLLRPEWKELVAQQFLKRGRWRIASQAKVLATDFRFGDLVTQSGLYAFSEGRCLRFIELELLRPWWKAVATVEREKYDGYSEADYASHINATSRRWVPVAAELFARWYSFHHHPSAQFRHNGDEVADHLVPDDRHLKRPQAHAPHRGDSEGAVADNGPKRARDFERFLAENGKVFSVRHAYREFVMRPARKPVPEPEDWTI